VTIVENISVISWNVILHCRNSDGEIVNFLLYSLAIIVEKISLRNFANVRLVNQVSSDSY
jgi:hypothetical protein